MLPGRDTRGERAHWLYQSSVLPVATIARQGEYRKATAIVLLMSQEPVRAKRWNAEDDVLGRSLGGIGVGDHLVAMWELAIRER